MAQYIQLTKGKVAIVDDADYEGLSRYKWCVCGYYAGSRIKGRVVYMHRFILNAPTDIDVDHIDGNPFNNQRSNLRLATGQDNARNQKRHRQGTSGYKGVSLRKDTGRWTAHITIDYKKRNLGCYDTPEDAARAYDDAARRHFGEFARTNFGY